MRGVRLYHGHATSYEEGVEKVFLRRAVHVDVYDEEGYILSQGNLPQEVFSAFEDVFEQQLQEADMMASPGFGAWSRLWRVGEHDAVHCQADNLVSIVAELRSGRFIRDLFAMLYRHVPEAWTFQAINLGAGLGLGDDDPLLLWTRDFSARTLLVDGDGEALERALGELGDATGVLLPVVDFVTPQSIEKGALGEAMSQAIGRNVDIVKVDIDSFDCAVLRAVLTRVEASVIVLESQPVVPPPFKFARHYSADYRRGIGLHGCSLAYQIRMLHPKYLLLLYTEHDTVFVHSQLVPWLEAAPPGRLFRWTSWKPRFPVDELDCYRRARSSSFPQGNHTPVPIDFLRDWAIRSHPLDALAYVAGNLTAGAPSGVLYALDL